MRIFNRILFVDSLCHYKYSKTDHCIVSRSLILREIKQWIQDILSLSVQAHSGQLNRVESMFGREEQAVPTSAVEWSATMESLKWNAYIFQRWEEKTYPLWNFPMWRTRFFAEAIFFWHWEQVKEGAGGVKVQFSTCVLTDWWWKKSAPTTAWLILALWSLFLPHTVERLTITIISKAILLCWSFKKGRKLPEMASKW